MITKTRSRLEGLLLAASAVRCRNPGTMLLNARSAEPPAVWRKNSRRVVLISGSSQFIFRQRGDQRGSTPKAVFSAVGIHPRQLLANSVGQVVLQEQIANTLRR